MEKVDNIIMDLTTEWKLDTYNMNFVTFHIWTDWIRADPFTWESALILIDPYFEYHVHFVLNNSYLAEVDENTDSAASHC